MFLALAELRFLNQVPNFDASFLKDFIHNA